ncbi:MAG: UGSC family (seleno)protein [Rhodospirillales bacterium]
MEFINPTGGTEIINIHAERLDTLDGKTIGFLTNDEWQAYRTLPVIKEALEDQFNVKVLALKTFPVGNNNIAEIETTQLVLESGVDAVILGNAA